MQSLFTSLTPNNSTLKNHIAYIYFDHANHPDFEKKYSFFPHTYTTLTFYKNASIELRDNVYHIQREETDNILMLLTRQQQVKTVHQKGKLDKIGIVFYPLGLNHFLQEPYETLAKEEVQEFKPRNASQWDQEIRKCFDIGDENHRLNAMENFLSSSYQPKEYVYLRNVIQKLSDVNNQQTIRTIAADAFIDTRKLNRDFKKELAITPEMFRIISRFRYIIDQAAVQKTGKRFIELAHESGYFDQPTLSRIFKRFTSLTPTEFLKAYSLMGPNGTVWQLHSTKNVV